jgi:hypothetical protein
LREPTVVARLRSQRAQRVVDDLLAVGAEEIRSPVFAPVRSMIFFNTSVDRNLTIGDCSPVSLGLAASLTLM